MDDDALDPRFEELVAERDRLIEQVTEMAVAYESEEGRLRNERDRMRDAVIAVHSELVFALGPDSTADIIEGVRLLRAERDRLRRTLHRIRFLVGPLDDDALVGWVERLAVGERLEAVEKPGETGGTGGGD